jgi:multidrug efflux pump subunit AcrA (membrane-fusion protein)
MRRPLSITAAAVILGSLVALGFAASRWSGGAQQTAGEITEEAAAPAAVPVEAVTIKTTSLKPALELVGTIVAPAERIAAVSPQLGGWVESIAVVEGQLVHKGDVLVRLDARIAETDLQRATAVVAEKEAVLARLKRGYLPHEVEVARQDRDKAQSTMEGLRSEVEALDALRALKEISGVQYDMKLKASKAAEAALASAEAHLNLLEAGTPPEMIDEARGLLDAAKADLNHAKMALEFCTMASPIDGVVMQLLARQGQYFAAASPLVTVTDLAEVLAQVRIPGSDFSNVSEGTRVDLETGSLPGRQFDGKVARISGQADPLTGNIDVFVAIDNADYLLRPGFGCHARVWLPEIAGTLAVPVSAVADHSGTAVVTVVRDGKAYEVEVELGAQTHELVQVVKGLSPGDTVVTAGGYGLPEGCPVRIVGGENAHKTARR